MKSSLWELVNRAQPIDPGALATALEEEVERPPLDYRTRLLVHEAADSLRRFWGAERYQQWVSALPGVEACVQEQFQEVGFPSLGKRLAVATRPETIRQLLRELGQQVLEPVRIVVGGSSALILEGLLDRQTEDVDLVDEVPPPLRELRSRLLLARDRYGLALTHFQSHYLPTGWEARTRSQGSFGRLEVHLVDPVDIAAGKLFSRREKDLDDLRALVGPIPRAALQERLASCQALLQDETLHNQAARNWYILFGEDLPGPR